MGSEVRPSADHFQFPLKPDVARDRRNVSNGSNGETLAASRCFPLCLRQRTCGGCTSCHERKKAVAGLRNRRRPLTMGMIRSPQLMWRRVLNKGLGECQPDCHPRDHELRFARLNIQTGPENFGRAMFDMRSGLIGGGCRIGGLMRGASRRIDRFSPLAFAHVSGAEAHSLAWPVVREGSMVCRSEADLGRFHPRASSISAVCVAHSRE
jgi:hypothetical protein